MAKKIVEIEMEFPDGFVPPEKYDEPTDDNNYDGECSMCPFFKWNDEHGYGWCVILSEEPATDVCPIKKSFK